MLRVTFECRRAIGLFLILASMSYPQTATADLSTALQLFDDGAFTEAQQKLDALAIEQPTNPEVLYYLARSQYRADNFDQAKATLDGLLKNHPNHIEAHYLMGSINVARVPGVSVFRKVSTAKDALASWLKVVSLDPKHIEGLYAVISFYTTAPSIAGGDLKKARAELPRLEALSPNWAMLAEASLLSKEQKLDEAEVLYRSASQHIQERAFPLFALANFQHTNQKYADALTTLTEYERRQHAWNDPKERVVTALRDKIESALGTPRLATTEVSRP